MTPLCNNRTVHVYTCPDLEPLIEELARELRNPLSDPMMEEIVVVPSADMANHLKRELGRRLGDDGKANGIVANVRFIYPRELINATASQPTGNSDSPWDATRLTWAIASIVASGRAKGLPRAFTASPLAASRRVADLFDRYASHRPEMLGGWAQGHRYDVATGGTQDWQVDLFRLAAEEIAISGAEARAFVSPAEFSATLTKEDLPDRMSVFGIDALSRSARQVLAALESQMKITAYWVYPLADKAPETVDVLPRREHQLTHVQHPLSSRWAAHAHESRAVVAAEYAPLAPLARGTTLLERFQSGVIIDTFPARTVSDDETRDELLANGDGSIQVHACYGLSRQVEALRDSLLHLLNENENLRLRDVLVVCGDVAATAPILSAIFDPEQRIATNVPTLPINVLRDADVRLDELSEAFMAILDLATGRCSASQLLDAAALAPVRHKFGFDDEALDILETWTEQLGVRYGLTAGDRAAWRLDASIASGTWKAAVDRLLMGVAVPAEREIAGPANIVPFDGVGSSELVVAGTLVEFLVRLETIVRHVRDDKGNEREITVDEWRELLLSVVDNFLDTPRDQAERLVRLRGAINRMQRDASKAIDTAERHFALRDLRLMTNDYLSQGVSDFWSVFESITVTSLGGMSHVPYKVIAFVGADEAAFAAPRGDGDDVLSVEPRVGEPLYSLRGRQNLLDLLMSARSNFILTCNGSDVNSNKDVPLAVPVQELLEFVAGMIEESGEAGTHRVLARHPRHNFDSRVLSPGLVSDDAPFTFDETSRVAYEVLAAVDREEEPDPELASSEPEDQPTVSLPTVEVRGIEQILSVLKDPISYYYEEVLNVDIPELPAESGFDNRDNTIKGDGVFLLTVDALGRSAEGRRLLQIIATHDDHSDEAWLETILEEWESVRPLTGLLPPGKLGELVLMEISTEIRDIVMTLPEHLRSLQGDDVDCLVPFGDTTASLRVPGVVVTDGRHEFARVKYTRFADSMELQLWAEVVFLTIHRKGESVVGYLATRGGDSASERVARTLSLKGNTPEERLSSAETARRAIEILHATAASGPVHFFPGASRELVDGNHGKAGEKLAKDANRNPAIGWYLDGRSIHDVEKDDADPALVKAVRGEDNDTRVSEVELFGTYIWSSFNDTTIQTDSGLKTSAANRGSEDD